MFSVLSTKSAMQFFRQSPAAIAEQGNALQQVVRDQRQHYIELEVSRLAGDSDDAVVANNLGRCHRHGFGYYLSVVTLVII